MKKILVTGGCGFIGSHTIVELVKSGYDPVVYDNLSRSNSSSLDGIELICEKRIEFINGDIRDVASLESVFDRYSFDAVIHFAGLKAVSESVEKPLLYFENNVAGTINLLQMMTKFNVNNFVFSSSATVYGDTAISPLDESLPLASPQNPYGSSKLIVENLLRDLFVSNSKWNIVILRYFNPVGAHESGLIGENPAGIPSNVMPLLCQTAAGVRECFEVFGCDYNTHDGTAIRDYIHVMDLSNGHVSALNKVFSKCGLLTANLGTGKGHSVLDLINAFERVSCKKINWKYAERRPGDIDVSVACHKNAKQLLGWTAKYSLTDMCADAWRWQASMIDKKSSC